MEFHPSTHFHTRLFPELHPTVHSSIHPLSILLWGRWLLPYWLPLAVRAVGCSQARSPSAPQPWFASWKRRVNQQRESLRGHRNQGITPPHAAFLVNRSPFQIPLPVIFIFQHRAAAQQKPSKGWRGLEESDTLRRKMCFVLHLGFAIIKQQASY